MNIQMQPKKIIVVGDANVGKTTYLTRIRTGEFTSEHIPTTSVDIHDYTELVTFALRM